MTEDQYRRLVESIYIFAWARAVVWAFDRTKLPSSNVHEMKAAIEKDWDVLKLTAKNKGLLDAIEI